ncbi:MAG: zinc ribbon domain-containing protein [Clostridia bacterium]|nr:zinc ribbon domain-containing protein [Clostridia bacterium]
MENTKFCLYCGASLPEGARFCFSCGKAQEMSEAQEATPASEVATPPAAPAAETAVPHCAPAPVARPVQPKRKRPVLPWLKAAVLLLFATLMLVMAFLPIVTLKTSYWGEKLEVSLTPIDTVVFCFDSFANMPFEDVEDSALSQEGEELFEEAEEAFETLEDDGYNKLTPAERRMVQKVVMLSMRLLYQLEDTAVAPIFYLMAVLALLYLALCVALFVVALLHLLGSVGVLGFKTKLEKATSLLFCAVPAMMLVLYLAACANFNGATMATPAVLTLVWGGICVFAFFLLRMIMTPKAERRVPVARIISVCLTVVLLCMLFVPVLSVQVRAEFDGRSSETVAKTPMNLTLFASLLYPESEREDYEEVKDLKLSEKKEMVEELVSYFEYYKLRDVREGEANTYHHQIIKFSLAGKGVQGLVGVFGLIPIFYLLVMLGAALLLWQNLCALLGFELKKGSVLAARLLLYIASALALIVTIACVVVLNFCVGYYAPAGYGILMGAGSILVLVFSIASAACPLAGKPRETKEEEVYTEPEVW